MSDPGVATCAGCGRSPRAEERRTDRLPADEPGNDEQDAVVTGDGAPYTWSLSVDEHGRTLLCPDCLRTHARAIEAKLDRDWW